MILPNSARYSGFSSGTLSIPPPLMGSESAHLGSDTHIVTRDSNRSTTPMMLLENPATADDAQFYRKSEEQTDKGRRLLPSKNAGDIYLVSMHGFVERMKLASLGSSRLFCPSTRKLLDDACLLQLPSDIEVAILPYVDEGAIDLIPLNDSNHPLVSLKRPETTGTLKRGTSAACTMIQPLLFATGGYDHIVHLWQLQQDALSAVPRKLEIRHTSVVQSLLPIRDTSHKLISAGADCNVHLYDIAPERVVNSLRLSNSVYHAHSPAIPFCTLLELAHRELQFELRDYRIVPTQPVGRFGRPTERLNGRFIKGACSSSEPLFACGERDGTVCLWDLRKTDSPISIVNCFSQSKALQVEFIGDSLVVSSDVNEVQLIRVCAPERNR